MIAGYYPLRHSVKVKKYSVKVVTVPFITMIAEQIKSKRGG